jgi:hypothetical protein
MLQVLTHLTIPLDAAPEGCERPNTGAALGIRNREGEAGGACVLESLRV